MRATLLIALLLLVHSAAAQRIESAQPMGGNQAFQQLIEQELEYPVSALQVNIKGDVTVVVGVQADGTVQGMQVWRSVSPECDVEALRLVRMVRFHPSTAAEDRGAADHYFVVPFDPAKYKRWLKTRINKESPVFELPVHDTVAVFLPRQLDTQVVPLVPKGNAGFGKYLGDNMRYPEEAYRRSIEGVVKLQFTVEASGSVSNMVVLEELGGGCTAEAMRLVYKAPWAPGTSNGKRVRSQTEVSIRFSMPQQAR
jgi:periplasmic protein TonB